MRAIKTFLSVSVIFAFVYLNVFFVFSLTALLPEFSLSHERMTFIDVFFYSFPLSVVLASLISIFVCCQSQSFSPLAFYISVVCIFVLGMAGIRFFVLDVLKDKEVILTNWKPFKVYSMNKDKFFMFSRSHGSLLENIIGIQTDLSLGASQLYSEAAIGNESSKEVQLFSSKVDQDSLIFSPKKDSSENRLDDSLAFPLQSFLRDIYYMSYHILQLPLQDFIFNIAAIVFFLLALGYFSGFFTGLIAGLVIVWFTRCIFFFYRFFSFSVIEIIKDAGLFSNNILNFLPLLFMFLAGISLMGVWKLISFRKY